MRWGAPQRVRSCLAEATSPNIVHLGGEKYAKRGRSGGTLKRQANSYFPTGRRGGGQRKRVAARTSNSGSFGGQAT